MKRHHQEKWTPRAWGRKVVNILSTFRARSTPEADRPRCFEDRSRYNGRPIPPLDIPGNTPIPYCSGILHSTWNFHLFIPNPQTATPADASLFQFADIAGPEFLSNGSINASAAVRPPKEAHFQKIRNATVKGLPPGEILLEGDFELIEEVDGIPQFVMHAKVPFNVEENTIVSKQVGSHRKQV